MNITIDFQYSLSEIEKVLLKITFEERKKSFHFIFLKSMSKRRKIGRRETKVFSSNHIFSSNIRSFFFSNSYRNNFKFHFVSVVAVCINTTEKTTHKDKIRVFENKLIYIYILYIGTQ